MGHTADEWAQRVLEKLNDTSAVDAELVDVMAIGVVPALAQFSVDRPRSLAVDLTPTGRILPLPASAQGWVAEWSEISRIEAPAGYTPPRKVDDWMLTRDPADVSVRVVMLQQAIGTGEKARVFFTSTYPTPTTVASTDVVPEPAFEAVTSLAAAFVCTALATTAALGRQGALPTSFVDGTERARNLLDVAASLRVLYNTFIGLGSPTVAGAAGGGSAKTVKSMRIV